MILGYYRSGISDVSQQSSSVNANPIVLAWSSPSTARLDLVLTTDEIPDDRSQPVLEYCGDGRCHAHSEPLGYGADMPGVDQLAVDRGLSAYRFEPTALDKCPQ